MTDRIEAGRVTRERVYAGESSTHRSVCAPLAPNCFGGPRVHFDGFALWAARLHCRSNYIRCI
jgi:hypothetical protein